MSVKKKNLHIKTDGQTTIVMINVKKYTKKYYFKNNDRAISFYNSLLKGQVKTNE